MRSTPSSVAGDTMKSNPFSLLGVSLASTDAEIRKRYLELTREFPPEQNQEKFAAVREAYEAIRTLDQRAKYMLYEQGKEDTFESIIEEIECTIPRPRPSLTNLLQHRDPKT
jgi:curved DNA-binding protein CbpA